LITCKKKKNMSEPNYISTAAEKSTSANNILLK